MLCEKCHSEISSSHGGEVYHMTMIRDRSTDEALYVDACLVSSNSPDTRADAELYLSKYFTEKLGMGYEEIKKKYLIQTY